MSSEFDLIRTYFTRHNKAVLGIGDDCALMAQQSGMQTAVSCDMLVSGTHFFADTDPCQLGHKSLAVNLSDLAAMGARPTAFTLAISLPEVDANWLQAFSTGLFTLADHYACPLIGGDTTRGPLNICITIFGEVPENKALRRDAAQAGDDIWVSGYPGEARAGLEALQKNIRLPTALYEKAVDRLQKPSPRIELGLALIDQAHAAIDVSDGLVGDLGHILERSGVGAKITIEALPVSEVLANQDAAFKLMCILSGGDDYELCFTAPLANRTAIAETGKALGLKLSRIGVIEALPGLRLMNAAGENLQFDGHSFDHFAKP